MHNCGTRYCLAVTLSTDPQAVRRVVATYNESREPDAQGQPGRVTARQLVSVFVDGYPVLRPYKDLREALGGAYTVVSFSRAAGPAWHLGARDSKLSLSRRASQE
ncbi:hypothetical protein GCM10027193_22950 [Arenimonas aestuarii]